MPRRALFIPVSYTHLYEDREGDLWLGSNGRGVIRMKNRLVRMFTTADGLQSNTTITLLKSSDGRLWVGSRCGLSVFDGNKFRIYNEKDGLLNSCVNALAEDSNKDIWIGTVSYTHLDVYKRQPLGSRPNVRSNHYWAALPLDCWRQWQRHR